MPTFSPRAQALLKRFEGCKLTAYQDAGGVWTIGYGHTGSEVKKGTTWTQAQADAAFEKDTAKFAASVEKLIKTKLTNDQFGALVILAFNIGTGGFGSSTVLKQVNAGNLDAVPDAMRAWAKVRNPATGQLEVNNGLMSRRQAEIDLWDGLDDVRLQPVASLPSASAASTPMFVIQHPAPGTGFPIALILGGLAVGLIAAIMYSESKQRESAPSLMPG